MEQWSVGAMECWSNGVLACPGVTSAKQTTALENQVWARE